MNKWRIVEFIGITAAVVYAGVSILQWRDANKNFRAGERAWITLKQAKLFQTELLPGNPAKFRILGSQKLEIKAGEAPALEVVLGNSGDSPALPVKTFGIEWTGNGIPINVEATLLKPYLQSVSTLPKDGELPIQPSPEVLSESVVAEIASGQRSLAIVGYATYDDVFGVPHKSRFCSYYDRYKFNMVSCPGGSNDVD